MPNGIIQPQHLVPSLNNPLPLFAVWPETLEQGDRGITYDWRDRAIIKRLMEGDDNWNHRPWSTAPAHITEYLLLACGAVIVRNEYRGIISYRGRATFHNEISQQYGICLDGCHDDSIHRPPTPVAEARTLLANRNCRHFLRCNGKKAVEPSPLLPTTVAPTTATQDDDPVDTAPLPPIWIGDNYDNGGIFDARIFVIGESTYAEKETVTERRETTFLYNLLMATDHMGGGCQDRFRGNLVRAFQGIRTPTRTCIIDFWRSVVFCNYVTEPLISAGRAPTPQIWRDSHQPLSELMERHQPDFLVLCGYRMWTELMARPSVTLESLVSPI